MSIKSADSFIKQYQGVCYAPKWRRALCILGCLLLPYFSFAIKEENPDEEIAVSIEVRNVGVLEIPAIYHNKEVYLSITSVFDFIKVKNRVSPSYDSISGFFINEKDQFVIDETHSRITFQNKVYNLDTTDLIRSESNLYMNLKLFKTVFALEGTFSFRRLWVSFTTEQELPVVREMRMELMRRNMGRLKGDQKADTTIPRSHPFFHMGMADWAVVSTQQSGSYDDTRLNLGLGAVLAGGEADVSLNYYNKQPFNELQQFYQWRYVNNDYTALRQIAAGKIFTQGIASLYAPVVGVQASNAPTTYRRSYGTYTLSDKTEPGWVVELYVNDVLVDYKKSDASGFFTFDVPLIYGYTVVKLRFYGPYGEERTRQQYISVPFNFLPAHEFEYTASAGIVEDGQNSKYSRVATNYGLSSHITIGAGVEYLSSVTSGNTMPFVTTSLRLASRLLLSGEYTHGVRSRGILSYRFKSNLQIDIDYIKYAPGQTAIYYNYLEERKAILSIPIHGKGYSLFSRLTLDQITVPLAKYTNAELALTGSVKAVGINLTTYASFTRQYNPYFYSLGSVSFMLPKKFNFTGQLEYDYKLGKPAFMKFTLEKYVFTRCYINVAYQEFFTGVTESFTGNFRNFLAGVRYDFSFARVSLSSLVGNNNTYSRVETASGSLIYDAKTSYFNANNRNNVGKGGIVVVPYLDINCNGKRDPGEPRAPGLKLRVNGGRVVQGKNDTAIRILDLEAYTDYYVELSTNSFENIAWQLQKHTIKVTVEANNFTLVEVAVSVVGEVSGNVSLKAKDGRTLKAQGQMIINIYNSDGVVVAHAQSESDGYFSYIGLAPGKYTAGIDPAQLQKLHMTAAPIPFEIRTTKNNEGDVADGLQFGIHTQE